MNKTIAFTDDIPTPHKLYFGSTSSGNYYDTTAQKVLDASLINGVTLTTAQTITGRKTFSESSGGIMMSGANILTATDSTNQIGAVDSRFQNAYIRNVFLTYLGFRSDDGQTQVGNLGMGSGYAQIAIATGNDTSSVYSFNATDGFFHGGDGDVPCGRSDHRWSYMYGENADLSGDLALAATSHIDIGPLRLEYNSTAKALHVTKVSNSDTNSYGLYADGQVAAGGVGGDNQYVRYVNCTQTEYNNLMPDPTTMYFIGSPVTKIYIGTVLIFSEN